MTLSPPQIIAATLLIVLVMPDRAPAQSEGARSTPVADLRYETLRYVEQRGLEDGRLTVELIHRHDAGRTCALHVTRTTGRRRRWAPIEQTVPVPCAKLAQARSDALAVVIEAIRKVDSTSEVDRVVGCTDGGENRLEYTTGFWVKQVVQAVGGCSDTDVSSRAGKAILRDIAPYAPNVNFPVP